MASANTILKSAQHRDPIAERENVVGCEIEGAGVWDLLPLYRSPSLLGTQPYITDSFLDELL